MKNTMRYLSGMLLLAVVLVTGCAKKSDDHHHEETEAKAGAGDWKEMDNFHLLMAETFHPYKDSANLEPIKAHAEHLAMEAEKWAAAPLPEKVNNDEIKGKVAQLKTDTRALADKVKAGGTDEDIAAQLTAVHELFHGIQEGWYGGHSGHH